MQRSVADIEGPYIGASGKPIIHSLKDDEGFEMRNSDIAQERQNSEDMGGAVAGIIDMDWTATNNKEGVMTAATALYERCEVDSKTPTHRS